MLISNPFTSPFLRPVLSELVALLGGAFLVLLLLARCRPRHDGLRTLFCRWGVWAVIAPIYILAVLSGALTTLLLLSVMIWQGLREYAMLVGLPAREAALLGAAGLLAAPVALLSLDTFYVLAPLLLLAATLHALWSQRAESRIRHLALAVFGWGYVAWFLAHLMLLERYVTGGAGLLLALGLATALSDVGAFVVGTRWGRRRLAPMLSPHKTWEGVAGNIVGAYLGMGLLAFAVPAKAHLTLLVALPMLIALGAVWGDLLESSLKRDGNVKDAGAWLPGFGGLLDRIDSLIIVAPLVYYALHLSGCA